MKTRRQVVLLATALMATVLHTPIVEGQWDQLALAQQLLREGPTERGRALEIARAIGPQNTGPELRAALRTALEREGMVHLRRWQASRRGEVIEPLRDPEFLVRASGVVAELQDPAAIRALAGALGTGSAAIRALEAFGEQAAPAVLAVVTSPDDITSMVNDGLIALRLMVEEAGKRPLSADTLQEIGRAAQQRLTERQRSVTTVWRAIDLAAVLDDPDLRRIVESLASNRNEVVAGGVEDPELIDRTQKHAYDRLAGVPALPRP